MTTTRKKASEFKEDNHHEKNIKVQGR